MNFCDTLTYIILGAVALAIGTIAFYLSILVFKLLKKETNFPFHLPSIIVGLIVMIVSFSLMNMNFTDSEESEQLQKEKSEFYKTEEGKQALYQEIKSEIDQHLSEYQNCIQEAMSYQNSDKKNQERVNCVSIHGSKNYAYWRDQISRRDVTDEQQEELLNYYKEQFDLKISTP